MSRCVMIMGAGGHGIEPLIPFIDYLKDKARVSIEYVPADYGGNTGVVARTFEQGEHKLNEDLHGSKFHPVYPFGDINKFIIIVLSQVLNEPQDSLYGGKQRHVLDVRSDVYEVQKSAFERLASILNLQEAEINDFLSYLQSYLEYHSELLHAGIAFEKSPTCLGNLWHSFRFFQDRSLTEMNTFYHSRGVLSPHVHLHFTYSERQMLVGSTIADEFLLGEDIVDIATEAILPYSLKLMGKNGHWLLHTVSEEFLQRLQKAHMIVIPNGSIANWMSLINSSSKVRSILRTKGQQGRVYLMGNIFYAANEFHLEAYLELILENYDIPLQVLLPSQETVDILYHTDKDLLLKYSKQGKKPNLFQSQRFQYLQQHPFLALHRVLECEYGETVVGYKYNPQTVQIYLKQLFEQLIPLD